MSSSIRCSSLTISAHSSGGMATACVARSFSVSVGVGAAVPVGGGSSCCGLVVVSRVLLPFFGVRVLRLDEGFGGAGRGAPIDLVQRWALLVRATIFIYLRV